MDKAGEILELCQLDYSDLILLSCRNRNRTLASFEEMQRQKLITEAMMENLGPNGPGLIAINSVHGAAKLRRSLLPLGRKLALLSNDDRKRILKEHSLGSDVPLKNLDRLVSSFAKQLKYKKPGSDSIEEKDEPTAENEVHDMHVEFQNLGREFEELGFLMMDLGLCLARICDEVIGSQELELSLLESGTAKGRLIHYHSSLDNLIIKESAKIKGRRANQKLLQSNVTMKVNQSTLGNQGRLLSSDDNELLSQNQSALWQQWHYDYGIFTVLTDPMFMLSCDQQCPSPSGHTFLKVFHPAMNKVFMVKAPPECFIVQVGESADVLSKGILKATLHCVCKPLEMEELSRQTFVVFLQPALDKNFSLLDYPVERLTSVRRSCLSAEQNNGAELEPEEESSDEIHGIVPPLLSRMRDGMTFAEFSRQTTKQYYGGSGLQSKR